MSTANFCSTQSPSSSICSFKPQISISKPNDLNQSKMRPFGASGLSSSSTMRNHRSDSNAAEGRPLSVRAVPFQPTSLANSQSNSSISTKVSPALSNRRIPRIGKPEAFSASTTPLQSRRHLPIHIATRDPHHQASGIENQPTGGNNIANSSSTGLKGAVEPSTRPWRSHSLAQRAAAAAAHQSVGSPHYVSNSSISQHILDAPPSLNDYHMRHKMTAPVEIMHHPQLASAHVHLAAAGHTHLLNPASAQLHRRFSEAVPLTYPSATYVAPLNGVYHQLPISDLPVAAPAFSISPITGEVKRPRARKFPKDYWGNAANEVKEVTTWRRGKEAQSEVESQNQNSAAATEASSEQAPSQSNEGQQQPTAHVEQSVPAAQASSSESVEAPIVESKTASAQAQAQAAIEEGSTLAPKSTATATPTAADLSNSRLSSSSSHDGSEDKDSSALLNISGQSKSPASAVKITPAESKSTKQHQQAAQVDASIDKTSTVTPVDASSVTESTLLSPLNGFIAVFTLLFFVYILTKSSTVTSTVLFCAIGAFIAVHFSETIQNRTIRNTNSRTIIKATSST